jgi:hypothetical protein
MVDRTAEEIAAAIAEDWLTEQSWLVEHEPGPLRPRRLAAPSSFADDDVLRSIAPAVYVERLTGREVPPRGLVRCPLPGHEDRTPSFRVYQDAEAGWFCFGACARGGDIYNFAADLWGMSTQADFLELRRRLATELLGR